MTPSPAATNPNSPVYSAILTVAGREPGAGAGRGERLREYGAVRERFITGEPPAGTTVEVSRLFRPGLLIEVEVIAALPRAGDGGGVHRARRRAVTAP